MIGLPVLVYPLLMLGISRLQESREEASEARTSVVAVWGAVPDSLRQMLNAGDAHVGVQRVAGSDGSGSRRPERGHRGPAGGRGRNPARSARVGEGMPARTSTSRTTSSPPPRAPF